MNNIMKRSYDSFSSLTSINSINSINSHTKIFNSRDFQKYIANVEEDIIKYLTEIYDKKINNIVNRYEGRTNKLYIDLRRREVDYIKLSKKIDSINITNTCYYVPIINIDKKGMDTTYRNILLSLYIYSLFVIVIVISNFY